MPIRVVPRRDRMLNRHVKAAPIEGLRRGEAIFGSGEEASAMVLVREGHLCLQEVIGKGSYRTVVVAGPWELVGEEGLLLDGRRRYRAVAGEASTAQLLDGTKVTQVLSSSRVTRQAFLAGLEEDLALARHLAVGSGGPSVDARVASILVNLADRLGEEVRGGLQIPVRVTHQTLADLAGAHRSTVTTLLNDWLYQRMLRDVGRRLVLPTRSKLRRLPGVWKGRAGR